MEEFSKDALGIGCAPRPHSVCGIEDTDIAEAEKRLRRGGGGPRPRGGGGGFTLSLSGDTSRTKNEFRDVDRGMAVDADNWRDQAFARGNNMDQAAGQLGQNADYWGNIARGGESLSAEQLRQGLQQNRAAQTSVAAGARPGNAAMAGRNASIQMGRMGAGLAGQQAIAGIAERQQAAGAQQQALVGQGNLYGQARGQDLQSSLQSRQIYENARTARFGAIAGVPTWGEQILGAAAGGAAAYAAKSDMRAKEDITSGDAAARGMMEGLKAYKYKYKPEHQEEEDLRVRAESLRQGRGLTHRRNDLLEARQSNRPVQMPADDVRFSKPGYLRMPEDNLRKGEAGRPQYVGVMAQDLEKSPLGRQAVMDTPTGKAVDPAQLSMGLAAGVSNLHERLKKLEGGK